jgi:hypothetical protein
MLALEAPYEDVPQHLETPLWDWTMRWLGDPETVAAVGITFRLELPSTSTYAGHNKALNVIYSRCNDAEFFLELIEYLLKNDGRRFAAQASSDAAGELEMILASANSAYRVREDRRGLQMRTTPEVQAQVQAVVTSAAGSAGTHLATAWSAAYSRNPDATKAYSEAIKAVESALAPAISPNDNLVTLGKLIAVVDAKPSKWAFVTVNGTRSDGVSTVLSMMQTLWDGQTSRHGGNAPTRLETVGEGQAAVHLAATLVQFGVSGAFRLATTS